MSSPVIKRLVVVLGVLCVLLLSSSSFLFWSFEHLHFHSKFADEQTRIFDQMRAKALQSPSPADIADSLGYVFHYYPSGTKQQTGSNLDYVVERHRTSVMRDIIAHLRQTTGQNLGDQPEPWIQKYVKK